MKKVIIITVQGVEIALTANFLLSDHVVTADKALELALTAIKPEAKPEVKPA